jgi:hypothetical protein
MIERSVQMDGSGNGFHSSTKRAVRPTDLPTENRNRKMRHGKSCILDSQNHRDETFFIRYSICFFIEGFVFFY